MASINGNEAAGREILMQLGEHLLMGYGKVTSKMNSICKFDLAYIYLHYITTQI